LARPELPKSQLPQSITMDFCESIRRVLYEQNLFSSFFFRYFIKKLPVEFFFPADTKKIHPTKYAGSKTGHDILSLRNSAELLIENEKDYSIKLMGFPLI